MRYGNEHLFMKIAVFTAVILPKLPNLVSDDLFLFRRSKFRQNFIASISSNFPNFFHEPQKFHVAGHRLLTPVLNFYCTNSDCGQSTHYFCQLWHRRSFLTLLRITLVVAFQKTAKRKLYKTNPEGHLILKCSSFPRK